MFSSISSGQNGSLHDKKTTSLLPDRNGQKKNLNGGYNYFMTNRLAKDISGNGMLDPSMKQQKPNQFQSTKQGHKSAFNNQFNGLMKPSVSQKVNGMSNSHNVTTSRMNNSKNEKLRT